MYCASNARVVELVNTRVREARAGRPLVGSTPTLRTSPVSEMEITRHYECRIPGSSPGQGTTG